MGAFNFSIQAGLTVGLTNQHYTDDEIEQCAQENEIDTCTAREWLAEQDFDTIAEAKEAADNFVYKLNGWLDSVIDLGFENTTDSLYRAVVEIGYYDGFQIYIEDMDGDDGEHLLNHLTEWDKLPMELDPSEKLIDKVYATAQFILIDYAKRAGLGITAGGWTGGSAQYHQINDVWEAYKQGADAGLLVQWERINKQELFND